MILESYDKYEFTLLDCTTLTSSRLIEKLNKLGNEGWCVVQQFGSVLNFSDKASLLLQRKINVTKYESNIS